MEVLKSPIYTILNLTGKCNLRCRHCYGSYGFAKDLSLTQWKNIINDLIENEVFYVNITGGEPTVYYKFTEFIEYLSKKEVPFILTTNGIFSKKIFNTLYKNKDNIIKVKISLDGWNKQSYSFLRKSKGDNSNNLFNICIKNLSLLKKANIDIVISTVIHPKNISSLENFFPLLEKFNISEWLLSPITFIGRAEINSNILKINDFSNLLIKKIKKISENAKVLGIRVRLVDAIINFKKSSEFYFECGAATEFCEINYDGVVSPCALSRIVLHNKVIKFPNIKNLKFKEIWNSTSFNLFRRWKKEGCKKIGCKNFKKCNKCIPQSFLYFNNIQYPPPFCISIGKYLKLNKINKLKESEGYQKWLR